MIGFMTAKQARERQATQATSNTDLCIQKIKEKIENVVESGRVNHFVNHSFAYSVDAINVIEYFEKLGYRATLFDGGDCITISW